MSTIDRTQPTTHSALLTAAVRANFQAAADDIDAANTAITALQGTVAAGGPKTYATISAAQADGALSNGSYYTIPSSTSDGYLDLYLKNSSSSSTFQSTMPSLTAVADETTRATTAEALAFQPRAAINSGADINGATQIGGYLIFAGALNGPAGTSGGGGQLDVVEYQSRWVVQHFVVLNNPNLQWYRTIDTSGPTYSAWVPLGVGDSAPVYQGQLTSSDDFNTAILAGFYLVGNPSPANGPLGMSAGNGETGTMFVQRYNARFIVQTVTDIGDPTREYTRTIDLGGPTRSAWIGKGVLTALNNQLLLTAGDSITWSGTYQPSLGARLGGTVVLNGGFPSTTLAYESGGTLYYRDLCLVKLIDAVISGVWTAQDAAVAGILAAQSLDLSSELNVWKTTNFATLKYLWIAHGTNDYGHNIPLGADTDNSETTFCGAFNYANSQLMVAFPSLQIMWGAPLWRTLFAPNPAGLTYDADIFPNNNGAYLWQFVDAMIRLGNGPGLVGGVPSNRNHVPVYDAYRNSGINKWNWATRTVDGLHPANSQTPSYSAALYGHSIAGFMASHF